jgi:hypothetical protein
MTAWREVLVETLAISGRYVPHPETGQLPVSLFEAAVLTFCERLAGRGSRIVEVRGVALLDVPPARHTLAL